jgi:hypothetical protein
LPHSSSFAQLPLWLSNGPTNSNKLSSNKLGPPRALRKELLLARGTFQPAAPRLCERPFRPLTLGMGETLNKAINTPAIKTKLDIPRRRTFTRPMISGLGMTLVETTRTTTSIIRLSMGVSRVKSAAATSTGLRVETGTVLGSAASFLALRRTTMTLAATGSGTLTTS